MTVVFAHLTLILLIHYLVKCRSRSFAVYNNEFILGSACRLRKSLWDHKIIENLLLTVFNINQERASFQFVDVWDPDTIDSQWVYRITISDVDELKWHINCEWAGLSHTVIEYAVGECRQCLRACAGDGGGHFDFWAHAVIKMIWCDTCDFWETITPSHVCRFQLIVQMYT